MRILLILAVVAAAVLALGLVLRLLFPLPDTGDRPKSVALTQTGDTRLGRAIGVPAATKPGLSGVVPLGNARDSFAARVLLVQAADRTLDLQYYIWHGDTSGLMLLREVTAAADRGVRVRLLVDDNGTAGLDRELAALDAHPNAEVRLFNPFTIRQPKLLGYVMDFGRLNHRMHNKSLTADNQATIVGGRNVGDAYFGASTENLFADLDVLAVGAIVPEVSADFDRYWESPLAYPIGRIVPPLAESELPGVRAGAEAVATSPLGLAYAEAVREGVTAGLVEGRLAFEWVPVRMVSDSPGKAEGKAGPGDTLLGRLVPIVGEPRRSFGLVSAYFVPRTTGTEALSALAARGVQVTVLTNALNATDVALVHAGYAKHRRRLLAAGVRLFELKGEGKADLSLTPFRTGSERPVFRAQGSSLHAKTFTVDRDRVFVGSFNFDPRSAVLNTELGFVIASETLAGQLQDMMDKGLAASAYEVQLASDGRSLRWIETTEAGIVVHDSEPNTGPLQRAAIAVLGRLPIDWML